MNRYYDVISISKYLLTEVDRQKLRAERIEYQLILRKCNELGFEYVVVRKPQQRIFFGSGIERECLPTKFPALSPFMGRTVTRPNKNLAPTTYFVTKPFERPSTKKVLSQPEVKSKGYGGLALKSPRSGPPMIQYTNVLCYDIHQQPLRPDYKPFGKSIKPDKGPKFTSPGVGVYNIKKQKDFDRICRGKIWRPPAVRTLCAPTNLDRCAVCDCTPEVDFWKHFQLKKSLCRTCMTSEIRDAQFNAKTKSAKMKKLNELHSFERVRHCGYVHRHDGTKFAVKKIKKHELEIKFKTENYLEKFNFVYY